jgi:hypothetical protein
LIARLAEKHMTPQAKAAVPALLEPGESLADASLWADEHRGGLPKTAPWHYVEVPLDEPRYDSKFSGDVSSTGCVVDKINEFRGVVKDTSKSIEERRFALRFLVHCIENLHMPLHVGDNKDKGRNQTHVVAVKLTLFFPCSRVSPKSPLQQPFGYHIVAHNRHARGNVAPAPRI